MDEFPTKPVSASELLGTIDRLLSDSTDLQPIHSDMKKNFSLFDPTAILRACDNDADALRGICRDFQTYVPARMAELENALQHDDARRLREVARKLCSLPPAFSAAAVDLASELEDHSAAALLEQARPLVEKLETVCTDLLRLVDGLSIAELQRMAGSSR